MADHCELFSILEELYILLDQLAVVPPSIAILPPSETGIHTAGDFDAEAAEAAGFSDGAVKVLSSMPYLDYPLELQPNAKAITYCSMDQSDFEDTRELTPGLDGELAPPSIIKLTDSSASMGLQYMYDAETKLMFLWTPMMDAPVDDDKRDMTANYFHVNTPSKSPREALQPLIDKYRGLEYIIKPPSESIEHELYLEEFEYLRPYQGPEDRREESEASDRKTLSVLRHLRNLYLWCGWNLNTVEQAAFRRDEFIEKREELLAGVV